MKFKDYFLFNFSQRKFLLFTRGPGDLTKKKFEVYAYNLFYENPKNKYD